MPDAAELYQTIIMERAKSPRHTGKPAQSYHHGHGDNPMCGDRIDVFVADDGTQVTHESRGCAIMIASAELMADAVAGLTVDEVCARRQAFDAMINSGMPNPVLGDLNALSGVAEYRSRIRCATLPWLALAGALEGME